MLRKLKLFIQEEDTGRYVLASSLDYEGTILSQEGKTVTSQQENVEGVASFSRMPDGRIEARFISSTGKHDRSWFEEAGVTSSILLANRQAVFFDAYLESEEFGRPMLRSEIPESLFLDLMDQYAKGLGDVVNPEGVAPQSELSQELVRQARCLSRIAEFLSEDWDQWGTEIGMLEAMGNGLYMAARGMGERITCPEHEAAMELLTVASGILDNPQNGDGESPLYLLQRLDLDRAVYSLTPFRDTEPTGESAGIEN